MNQHTRELSAFPGAFRCTVCGAMDEEIVDGVPCDERELLRYRAIRALPRPIEATQVAQARRHGRPRSGPQKRRPRQMIYEDVYPT